MIDVNNLKDNKEGFLVEQKGSKHLVVTFGGINRGIGLPVFEFFNILSESNIDKVFVRDFFQMWYLNGVDDTINTLEKLKVQLENIIKDYERVTFIGNSMGGYAAILFGTLLNVNKVISFAPQTFIDARNRFWKFDIRWRKQINNIHKTKVCKEYYDLKSFFNHNNISEKPSIEIYYSSNDRLDKLHAERMQSFKNINLFEFKDGGHEVIRVLKESGQLHTILRNL